MPGSAPPDHAGSGSPRIAVDGFRHTRRLLRAYYALAVLWGLRIVLRTEPSLLDLLLPLALNVCLGYWAADDARRLLAASARY
jgi:hypothetical protein